MPPIARSSVRTAGFVGEVLVPAGETQRAGAFERRPHAARRLLACCEVARARRGERVRLDGEREAAELGPAAPYPTAAMARPLPVR